MSSNTINSDCNDMNKTSVPSVPIGLRLYASCSQGGRKYMEDNYDLKYQFNSRNELQYVYLAIFDGHGGDVAAKYAKQWLCLNIIRQRGFWSDIDEEVLKAIQKGFIQTHYDMRKEVCKYCPETYRCFLFYWLVIQIVFNFFLNFVLYFSFSQINWFLFLILALVLRFDFCWLLIDFIFILIIVFDF